MTNAPFTEGHMHEWDFREVSICLHNSPTLSTSLPVCNRKVWSRTADGVSVSVRNQTRFRSKKWFSSVSDRVHALDQFVIRVVHIFDWSPTKARNPNSLWYSVFNCKEKTWIHTFPKSVNRKGIELYLNSTHSYYLYTNTMLQSRDTTEIQNSKDNIKHTWQHSILYITITHTHYTFTLYVYIIHYY